MVTAVVLEDVVLTSALAGVLVEVLLDAAAAVLSADLVPVDFAGAADVLAVGVAVDFIVDFAADPAFCVSAGFTELTTGAAAAKALPAPPIKLNAAAKAATFFVHFFMIGHLIL
ncbi:hypothetical protein [Paenibacillus sp. AN1007]|uniref:Secreted protein n=1 Tax=Paenibacillus sp. AN1007 TaxID=3151385 RepID=A0AAU8NH01_9BACL